MVSIIIPFHNRFDYVDRCLESLKNQTYQDFEIILIDDVSASIYTPQILQNKITLIRNEKNIGPGGSRNAGMKIAKGSYWAFLDSDDYWHPHFLEKTILKLQANPSCIFTYAYTMNVQQGKEVELRRENSVPRHSIFPEIYSNYRAWCTSACLWNAQYIKKDIQWAPLKAWEDYYFDTIAAIQNNQICCVEEPLVYYELGASDKLSNAKVTADKLEALYMASAALKKSDFKTNTQALNPFLICYIGVVSSTKYSPFKKIVLACLDDIYQWTKAKEIHPIITRSLLIHSSKLLKKYTKNVIDKLRK